MPLSMGKLGPPSNTMWPGTRPTSVPSEWHLDPSNRLATIYECYRQDRQTDRLHNGRIALSESFYKRSPNKWECTDHSGGFQFRKRIAEVMNKGIAEFAGVEIAGLENDGRSRKGGKWRTGKWRTYFISCKLYLIFIVMHFNTNARTILHYFLVIFLLLFLLSSVLC